MILSWNNLTISGREEAKIAMDEIKQAELRKTVDEILSGGTQAVEGFSYANYTEEELEFLEREMNESNTKYLEKFMQDLDDWYLAQKKG
jgi:hypothetical protein